MNLFETQFGQEVLERIVSGVQRIAKELEESNELKSKELEFYSRMINMVTMPAHADQEEEEDDYGPF